MNRSPVIVDTNVVVAGLLTGDDASPVARILDGMLAAAFPFVLSEALLAEYRTVLVRPSLRKQHGLTIAEIESILTALARHAIVLIPVPGPRAPDRGDQLYGICSLFVPTSCWSLATSCCCATRPCRDA